MRKAAASRCQAAGGATDLQKKYCKIIGDRFNLFNKNTEMSKRVKESADEIFLFCVFSVYCSLFFVFFSFGHQASA